MVVYLSLRLDSSHNSYSVNSCLDYNRKGEQGDTACQGPPDDGSLRDPERNQGDGEGWPRRGPDGRFADPGEKADSRHQGGDRSVTPDEGQAQPFTDAETREEYMQFIADQNRTLG